ncbi:Smr/MutS family protein [Nannocystis pusilla]|uniref:Smr/MutS family protein n=1 Tax=Nannocystis pusilla TaxID=889268 RepID=A0A9X3EQM9_9BACT|nr:Smr/MutS family protein [Nannocystis pusilla]MCY1007470.1 Smr/MutS family protein [Nannocystis pusilla]
MPRRRRPGRTAAPRRSAPPEPEGRLRAPLVALFPDGLPKPPPPAPPPQPPPQPVSERELMARAFAALATGDPLDFDALRVVTRLPSATGSKRHVAEASSSAAPGASRPAPPRGPKPAADARPAAPASDDDDFAALLRAQAAGARSAGHERDDVTTLLRAKAAGARPAGHERDDVTTLLRAKAAGARSAGHERDDFAAVLRAKAAGPRPAGLERDDDESFADLLRAQEAGTRTTAPASDDDESFADLLRAQEAGTRATKPTSDDESFAARLRAQEAGTRAATRERDDSPARLRTQAGGASTPAATRREPEPPSSAVLQGRTWAGSGWRDEPGRTVEHARAAAELVARARRGRLPTLRLRGLRREPAVEALAAFAARERMAGTRYVRVVTGKGLGSPGDPVLKEALAEWCASVAGEAEVAAWAPELDVRGEYGSVILQLRPRA